MTDDERREMDGNSGHIRSRDLDTQGSYSHRPFTTHQGSVVVNTHINLFCPESPYSCHQHLFRAERKKRTAGESERF